MGAIHRVLDEHDIDTLEEHVAVGGGIGLDNARAMTPEQVVEIVDASGLRGRGGAGFPTGAKWRAVTGTAPAGGRVPVVVNGAEGEPGTFKDRTLLRRNPFRVLEGALIAAHAVGGSEVIVALASSSAREAARVRDAVAQARAAGWLDGIAVRIVAGPPAYLFGEETALLEVIEGRPPFPRVDPPYRRGLDVARADATDADASGVPDVGNTAATVELVGADDVASPALVDNVETMANLPGLFLNGVAWFRSVGTEASPGTIVCTVTGRTARHGVAEFAMGTTLAEVIESIGGGPEAGRTIAGAVSGTANAILPASAFDTPVSYEAMAAAGSGLGTGGFIVFDDRDDPVAVAAGVARFLAVESCGQCEPCKRDTVALSDLLARIGRNDAEELHLLEVADRVSTVADGARCALARQTETVVGSLLERYDGLLRRHVATSATAVEPVLVAPIEDIVDGVAVVETWHADKQPDWTYDATESGQVPAERYEGASAADLPAPPSRTRR